MAEGEEIIFSTFSPNSITLKLHRFVRHFEEVTIPLNLSKPPAMPTRVDHNSLRQVGATERITQVLAIHTFTHRGATAYSPPSSPPSSVTFKLNINSKFNIRKLAVVRVVYCTRFMAIKKTCRDFFCIVKCRRSR